MKFAIEVTEIGGPEFLGLRACLFNPFRKSRKYVSTSFPVLQIWGASNRDFPVAFWTVIGREEVPDISIFDDGRIVGVLHISGDGNKLRRLFRVGKLA
jgi:hypothetical protein